MADQTQPDQMQITIVGRIDVVTELSQDEMDYFESAWNSINEFFTVNTPAGKVRLLNQSHKAASLVQVKAYKKSTGLTFEGNDPVNGFGMDIPCPEDLLGAPAAGNNPRWEYTTIPATHAIASRYTGNWLGNAILDTLPGWSANSILLKDANNDPWSFMMMGVMNMLPFTGIIEGCVVSMNSRPRNLMNLKPWEYVSDIAFHDFKRAYHIDPITPFQADLQIKDGVGVPPPGPTYIAPFPVGTICKTARRALQRGVAVTGMTRPVPA